MTIKLFALTSAIFMLLSQPSFLLGQNVSEQQNWEAVQALSTGVKLLIETKDGKQLKGNLANASLTTLALIRNNKTNNLNKDDIRKIYQLSGGSRAKSALLGTAVGAGGGAGVALILLGSTGGSDDTNGILGTGAAIGAGIGAIVGLLLGKSSRRVLVYESN